MPRGDIASIIGATNRHARHVTLALIERDVLTSESSRAPLHLNFPVKLASRWIPRLFPEQG
ncbi:MAG: hypothetical protein L0210_13560 [Rhodospirillales bacterium]|nr:hypothetical protein [Rhodospirillales bacterium]